MDHSRINSRALMPSVTSSQYFTNSTASRSNTPASARTPARRRSRKTTGPSAATPKSHQLFQSSNSVAASTPGLTPSNISTSLSRPTTASGRKSRATNASSVVGEAQTIVCAVCEARGVSPSVGIAFVNTSLGEAVLSQICDNQSYVKTLHKIRINWPSRIICLAQGTRPTSLMSLLRTMFADIPIDVTDRSFWSETKGIEYINKLAFETDIPPIQVAIQGKYYAVSALAAAMAQIEHQFSITFAPHSLRLRYQPSDDTMMIDVSAIQCLEIVQNSHSSKSKDSLFGLLNHCVTPMGNRMLRSNIIQPPTLYESFIAPRYDAVEELTLNDEMFLEIRKTLKKFLDVEKLLTKLITIPVIVAIPQAEQQINQVLMIKSFLEAAKELHLAMRPATAPLLVKIRELCSLERIGAMSQKIHTVLESDVSYTKSALDLRNQRTFAVRTGISGVLDVSRQAYKELTEEIHNYVEQLNEKYNVTATLKFDNGRKYWLKISIGDYNSVDPPGFFINVVKKRGAIECQTLDLVKLNMRLSDTSNEVVFRSDAIIEQLIATLQSDASHLFKMCESIGLIDMLASFTQLKQHCFHIVTGFNMGGKSTYIRAIALLQIMAQIGCFVPAEYASFSVVHNVFTRISLSDNIEAGLSSFSVEMRDMAFILRNVDQQSMVIIDELGRGTSTRDGLAIAIAMAEALIQSKAFVWFATHFLELARALANRPGVLNLHLATDCSVNEDGVPCMTMLYKTERGPEKDEQDYGINLAKAIGFPDSIIRPAEEYVRATRLRKEASKQSLEAQKLQRRRQLILGLHEALKQARADGAKEALPGYLKQLQHEFVTQMAAIEDGD
ncbi:MutS domain V [Beauveria bassiana ARSEF 2860]|uniref:DNA mismatch repair protein MSH3 n=1 Tax=Beauveria bassiana (strain ARSEF 2860) TaxID=655819 RepID=J5K1M5_BEAB2|nr:MutS domain V [Beauveria bassiana ARSEF 2860]EJP68096.1 MutS domain V [Beauveria bassiana ARSEF 2860]